MKTTLVRQPALALLLAAAAHAEEFDSAGVKLHYTTTGQGDPVILVHGLYSSAKMNEDEVQAVRVPVTLLAGERDPCRRLYIEPLRRVRPDWLDHVIAGAGHLNCLMKAEFKEQLLAALQASPPPSVPAKTP
jgi:pimeloyl-ACP methyl ester carboxylesterase